MKSAFSFGSILALALTGCAVSEPAFDLTGKEPVLKHVMLPTPATDSDSVIPGVGNIPYVEPVDGTERRFLAVSFDSEHSEPDLLHTVHFKTDSHQMSAAEQNALKANRYLFKDGVTLSGYADPRGSDEYNQRLSEKRVQNVRQKLNQMGVSTDRECSYGENRLPDIHNCEE